MTDTSEKDKKKVQRIRKDCKERRRHIARFHVGLSTMQHGYRDLLCYPNISTDNVKEGIRLWLTERNLIVKDSDSPYVTFQCTKDGSPYVLLVCIEEEGCIRQPEQGFQFERVPNEELITTIWSKDGRGLRAEICSPSLQQIAHDVVAFYRMTHQEDTQEDTPSANAPEASRVGCRRCPFCFQVLQHYCAFDNANNSSLTAR
eukprot:gb/GECG01004494.1/.p1 GENE.gb/GECG01004494.1/~~gb/GECG01004494.1/.p1  ORF type:complete len:202 (+),score=20.37 gb/GECG01004494.1/:1-606(+)